MHHLLKLPLYDFDHPLSIHELYIYINFAITYIVRKTIIVRFWNF